MAAGAVPQVRIRDANFARVRREASLVMYWMVANRRTCWNFALQRAVEWANELAKPLAILEYLPCGNRWDCDRLHRFALEGMADNRRSCEKSRALYYPYAETRPREGLKLMAELARHACVVVTDDFPCFVHPQLVDDAGARVPVLVEAVDSNGLVPLRAAPRVYPSAYTFRRFLQKTLPEHLMELPAPNPLAALKGRALKSLPKNVARRWRRLDARQLQANRRVLAGFPLDHSVGPGVFRGGHRAAAKRLDDFLDSRLARYAVDRNHPDRDATSNLSAHLHFGHISAHEIVRGVLSAVGWIPARLGRVADGRRAGWWGVPESAEAFLDQVVTWRELGCNMSWQNADYDQFDSLPAWARASLDKHTRDRRPHLYALGQLEAARTDDALWNAAQTQLVREGRLHNYLRMLWGKRILEWSPSPREALDVMIHLNNKYALDGRNPNSYSGIFWVLGRYDRPWGPERAVFGKIRYMSSANTARKVAVREYLTAYAP